MNLMIKVLLKMIELNYLLYVTNLKYDVIEFKKKNYNYY